MQITPKISPCLWFDNEAEQAAKFYVSVFPHSEIENISYYGSEGREQHGQAPGKVMMANFRLAGQPFLALNGGPQFKFSEAISFSISCEDQKEVDHFWDKLTADGGAPSMCGWLKDKFGVSWQVVPSIIGKLMTDPDRAKAGRAMQALMQMSKIDIATLVRAYEGR